MKPLRAVVVEDDENDLLIVADELRRYGFAVETTWVTTAAELRGALDAAPYDIVLADYRLPRFSGREALELVRSGGYDVPFILVTAILGDELAVEMMRRGADDYVLKDRMARLGYCVERAVHEYGERRARTRAHQDLAAVQRRFQETFEHAPIGILHINASGRFSLVNDRFCEMVGYTREELALMTFLDITHPDDHGASACGWIETHASTREPFRAEKRYVRKDGAVIWVDLVTTAMRSAAGELEYVLGMVQEITARKVAEETVRRQGVLLDTVQEAAAAALRRSEERYREVIEGVVEIIIGVATDGTVTSVNRAFEVSTGWTREEFIGHRLWELVPPEGVASAQARFEQRLRGEELAITGQMLRKDGSAIIIDGVAYVARNGKDETEVFYFLRDVTDRTRLDRQFRLVLDSTDEGIYAVDADGICTILNRAAAQILGYAPEELIGRCIHDVIHFAYADGTPYDRARCAVYRTLQRGTRDRVRNEVYWRRDGTPVPVEYASAPILENGAIVGAVTTFSDVSQRRMLESQLEKANRLNGLGRIAATIAHEFNNVLMGIQPFTEILRIEAGDNERLLRSVDRIATSVRRGKRVTSEILQFTRQSEPAKKPIDVASWIADLAAEARHFVGESVAFVAHGDSGLTMLGDSAALQQVFMNMIVNARDALDGTGLIAVTACPSEGSVFPFGALERGDTFVHFTVSDDGPGMSAATQQHIFEPLFTTKQSGTGLGLALAHHVVQQHGGAIFVESEEGAGTTFHIFLPRAEEAVEPRMHLGSSRSSRPHHLRSVVLVEDDVSVAAGLVNLLTLENVRVHVAPTGGAAVETIERTAPDAVVLDVGLPDVDGTLVYEAIAARWPLLPVVFATGHADGARLHAYLTRPNVGHVLKPYQLATLYNALAEITDGPAN